MDKEDEIRKVAYELYERSGRIPGREVENWLKAEKIVMARYGEEETTKAAAQAVAPRVKKAAVRPKAAKKDPPKTGTGKTEPRKAGAGKTPSRKKPKKGEK
jgi:hypothetical protein